MVRSCTKRVPLSTFKGMRVAIDGFTWLHRAACICAKDFYHNPRCKGILTFCVRRIQKIRACGLTPIFVLDGRPLPSKKGTDASRREKREAMAARIEEMERAGEDPPNSYFQQAVAIQWETIEPLLNTLSGLRVPYVIAPYEADAQLAFLARTGLVDCVLTEDSDLLPYLCPLTLFKLDGEMMVDAVRLDDVLHELSLEPDQFIAMCVLIGCDYAEHIRMMGAKTAHRMITELGSGANVIAEARRCPKFTVPDGYEDEFARAFATYHHQMVFDPRDEMMKPLTPISGHLPVFIGPVIPRQELLQHVTGRLNSRHTEPLVPHARAAQRPRPRPQSQHMRILRVSDLYQNRGPIEIEVTGNEVTKTQISDLIVDL